MGRDGRHSGELRGTVCRNMTKSKSIFAIFIAVFISSCGQSHPKERVSLFRLLSNPEEFEGHRIQVSGFFTYQGENVSLYFSSDDAQYGMSSGGIEIGIPYDPHKHTLVQCSGHYVDITGVFHAHAHSQWAMPNLMGKSILSLTNIEQIHSPPYRYLPNDQGTICFGERD
jgi:hypothetical protein